MSSEQIPPKKTADIRATVHIGASSISLLIFSVNELKEPQLIDFLEQSVPIAHDVFSRGKLSRTTIERCVNILDGYHKSLAEIDPRMVANNSRIVATNILSEASNKEIFLNRIHISCNLEVKILDDGEMTRLIYLKTRRRLSDTPSMKSRTTLVIHTGPGNTRAILLKKGRIISYSSYRLGVHRTGKRVNSSDSLIDYRKNIRSIIQGPLDSIVDEFKEDKIEHIVLIGYEIQLLRAQISHHKDKSCSVSALKEFCNKTGSLDDDEVVQSFNIDYQTAEAVLPALEISLAIVERLQPKRLHIPESDYEKGLLCDLNSSLSVEAEFTREVIRSAEKIAKKYRVHLAHARQVSTISLSIFNQLQDLHKLDKHDALLLQLAAILHESGGFISNRAHHKHSQYIILHSDIFGLPRVDMEIVALIARYHRNSHPKPNHAIYRDLDTQNRMRVSKLASFLRIADALDRSHSARVKEVELRVSRRRLHIHLNQVPDAHIERIAMLNKGDLFENVFGLEINIVEDKIS